MSVVVIVSVLTISDIVNCVVCVCLAYVTVYVSFEESTSQIV